AHVATKIVGHRQILFTIAVEVADRHGTGAVVGGEVIWSGEAAAAIPQQHAHVTSTVVGRGQVLFAVVVEVPDRHGKGTAARGEVDRPTEEYSIVVDDHRGH